MLQTPLRAFAAQLVLLDELSVRIGKVTFKTGRKCFQAVLNGDDAMSWLRPQTLQQALTWLDEYRPTIVCGGTDLFVNWPRRRYEYEEQHWLDIQNVPELKKIERDATGLHIGAAVTAAELWQSELVQEATALQQAARVVGGWQIQNRASLGGNIANASPAADMVVPLVAYGAGIRLESKHGARTLSISEFITGPRQTAKRPDELIATITIPAASLETASAFVRLDQRGATDISIVSAAVALAVDGNDIAWGRVAVGAAHPVPLTLPEVDEAWRGKLTPELVEHVAGRYAAECRPISDVRASAEYRRAMVKVFITRAVRSLFPDGETAI